MPRHPVPLALAVVLALGWLGSAAAEEQRVEAVVIAATAPGFAREQRLGGEPILVPDGASLVLLLASGQVVTLRGPYAGPPRAPVADASGRLGRLTRLGGTDQSTISGTRSVRNLDELARAVPFDLYLATYRGRRPVYPRGEPVRFIVQANRDAYVYCWLQIGRDRIVPLFPRRADGAGPRPGGETLWLPRAGAAEIPAGRELDGATPRCLAGPAPLDPALVQGFLDAGGGPLPAPLAQRLASTVAAYERGEMPDGMLAQLALKVR